MKFAIVGPTYPWRGGIAHYTTSLYLYLRERYPSFLVSFSRQYPKRFFPGRSQLDPSESPLLARPDYKMDSLDPLSWIRTARRIRGYQTDIVLFQWWHPFFAPAYAGITRYLKRRSDSRAVFICHNVLPHESLALPGGDQLGQLLTKTAFRKVDAFLVHAATLRSQIRRFNLSAPIGNAFHPSYGLNSTAGFSGERPSIRRKPKLNRLLFFGNIRKYKGLEVLLKALPLVAQKIPIRLLVAGEFYLDARPFHRLADELGVQDLIVWQDRYIPNEEVADLFRKTDLVVLPYLAATQSGIVPLAYSFGVPVLTTDVGGLSEVVLNDQTGYVVAPGEPNLVARKILSYFRTGRKEPFQANIRRFRKNLSWRQVVDTILALPGVMSSPQNKPTQPHLSEATHGSKPQSQKIRIL